MPTYDLTGQRFGRLVALRAESADGVRRWVCICDCGNECRYLTGDLRRKVGVTSCGCKRAEALSAKRAPVHGMTRTRTYKSWQSMHQRCANPNTKHFAYYGGRGISVCARWNEFANFLEDMGVRPPGRTLDRIETDGNYEKGNCRWATPAEQQANRRAPKPCTKRGSK
jgi:hypothetical protein